jgi:hypothetical protein
LNSVAGSAAYSAEADIRSVTLKMKPDTECDKTPSEINPQSLFLNWPWLSVMHA